MAKLAVRSGCKLGKNSPFNQHLRDLPRVLFAFLILGQQFDLLRAVHPDAECHLFTGYNNIDKKCFAKGFAIGVISLPGAAIRPGFLRSFEQHANFQFSAA